MQIRKIMILGLGLLSGSVSASNMIFIDACRNGHRAKVRVLLRVGADVNECGGTPLRTSAARGHAETVKLLLDSGAKINLDDGDSTALMWAAKEGHVEAARQLLAHYSRIDVNVVGRVYGYTALMYAAKAGHTEVVKALLNHRDIKVNIVNPKGRTALMLAAYRGHTEVVKALLNHDAKINLIDRGDNMAVTVAFKRGHIAVVELLEQHIRRKERWSPERSAWVGTVVRVSKKKYPNASWLERLDLD